MPSMGVKDLLTFIIFSVSVPYALQNYQLFSKYTLIVTILTHANVFLCMIRKKHTRLCHNRMPTDYTDYTD